MAPKTLSERPPSQAPRCYPILPTLTPASSRRCLSRGVAEKAAGALFQHRRLLSGGHKFGHKRTDGRREGNVLDSSCARWQQHPAGQGARNGNGTSNPAGKTRDGMHKLDRSIRHTAGGMYPSASRLLPRSTTGNVDSSGFSPQYQ